MIRSLMLRSLSRFPNHHFEVCKHLSLDEHARIPDLLLMSTAIWDRLTPEKQDWVQEAADESSLYQGRLWTEKSDEAIAAVQENGVLVYRLEKAPCVEACSDMRASNEGTPIGELLEHIEGL